MFPPIVSLLTKLSPELSPVNKVSRHFKETEIVPRLTPEPFLFGQIAHGTLTDVEISGQGAIQKFETPTKLEKTGERQ
jgi:hypothetical protein